MKNLMQWGGSFHEDEHRYFRKDGKELQGITGMIKSLLFKDEYKGVSQATLAEAADRGHKIHSQVELYDNMGVGNTPEVAAYSRLKEAYELEHIASEFLVSDDENYATAIDKVYHVKERPEDEVVLGDIKTTYNFNREYVSWQLSVEAYFFEMLNPTIKVGQLIGIWLRNDKTRGMIAKVIPVDRKPVEVVKELIDCAINDRPFNIEKIPQYISDNLDRLIWITETINALTAEKAEITKDILENMQKGNIDKVDTGVILFSRKAAATRTTFDTKAFRAEHEDLYNEYAKTSVGEETLQIKLRDK